jgi:hypothetical protein
MGWACSRHGGDTKTWFENVKRPLGDIDVDRRITLTRIINK